jgi:tellurite resistance protein TerC
MHSIGTGWMWLAFFIFIVTCLAIDIFLLDRKKTNKVSMRQALYWGFLWLACALVFSGLLGVYLLQTQGAVVATKKTLEFFTSYVIEQSLSVDNMFAFVMVFNSFAVPPEYQRRVLLYGIIGAIILRLLMILGGVWLIAEFHWLLYLFGGFLVVAGIKMLFPGKDEKNLAQHPVLSKLRQHLRVTENLHEEKFFVKQKQRWYVTPLFLALILVEISDLIFAIDSVPAIFSITTDAFIIFTSNIFAILGLRAWYFILVNMLARFHLLKYGIALILTFVGVKLLLLPWLVIPVVLALGVVIAILVVTVMLSLLRRARGSL